MLKRLRQVGGVLVEVESKGHPASERIETVLGRRAEVKDMQAMNIGRVSNYQ